MTSKRRKIVNAAKPPTDPNKLLSDGIKKAIEKAGCSSHSSTSGRNQRTEEIAGAMAADTSLQSSYRERLRQGIRNRMEKEPDYDPERFPNCAHSIWLN